LSSQRSVLAFFNNPGPKNQAAIDPAALECAYNESVCRPSGLVQGSLLPEKRTGMIMLAPTSNSEEGSHAL